MADPQFQSYQAQIGFRFIKGKNQDVEGDDFFVEGWASSDDVDFEDDVFDKSAMEAMAQGLLISSTIFYNHYYDIPIGKAVEADVRPTERGGWGVWIKTFISKTAIVPQTGQSIRQLIAEEVLTGFSVGGRLIQTALEFNEEIGRKVRRILDFLIYEVSVVGVPCNRRARAMEWYVKMYRGLAEQANKLMDVTKLDDLKTIAVQADSFIVKGTPPSPPEELFEEAATREEAETMSDEKGAVRSHTSEKADRARRWTGSAAVKRLKKKFSSDGSGDKDKMQWARYRMGFAWFDGDDTENFGAYKLPHHDVIDGDVKVVFRGVVAAVVVVQGGRGGVDLPEGDVAGVKRHLKRHYQQFEEGVDPFEKSVDENEELLKSLETARVTVSKALELGEFELMEFVNNIWQAGIDASRETGVFGVIDDDMWFPLHLRAVFDKEVVFFNPAEDTMYKASFSTTDGLEFEFGEGIEVRERTIYEEIKSLEDVEQIDHPLFFGAMPEHQTEISDSDEWSAGDALDALNQWASRDGSGDLDTIDWERFSLAFAWFGPDDEEGKKRYSLMHHQVEDDELMLNTKGLSEAVSALKAGDLGIPDEDIEAVQNHLVAHLRQVDPEAANPFDGEAVEVQDGDVVVDESELADGAPEPQTASALEDGQIAASATEPVSEPTPDPEPVVGPETAPEEPQVDADPEPAPVADPEPEPASEPVSEPELESEEAKSTISSLIEEQVLQLFGDILGTSADRESLQKLLAGIKHVSAPQKDIDFDPEAAEQRVRRFCSSDGSGDKETIDWKKYAGFFGKLTGNTKSFASYSRLMFDIADDGPAVVSAAVESIVDAHKVGELELSELDKRRVQAAYQLFGIGDPFVMSAEEAARKEVNDRFGEVMNQISEVTDSIKGLDTVVENLKKELETAPDPDEVKNLSESVEGLTKRLELLEEASGMTQQLPPGQDGNEHKSIWQGVVTRKGRALANKT